VDEVSSVRDLLQDPVSDAVMASPNSGELADDDA
jgi:hypothetical protein